MKTNTKYYGALQWAGESFPGEFYQGSDLRIAFYPKAKADTVKPPAECIAVIDGEPAMPVCGVKRCRANNGGGHFHMKPAG